MTCQPFLKNLGQPSVNYICQMQQIQRISVLKIQLTYFSAKKLNLETESKDETGLKSLPIP